MFRSKLVLTAALTALVAVASGCGETTVNGVRVPKTEGAVYNGAVLFNNHCSGCHTLDAANTQGSKPLNQISGGERTNGPNLNVRRENREDVLFAIRNGGFSGAIMPANIVTGKDAADVAAFVERYAGAKSTVSPQNTTILNK